MAKAGAVVEVLLIGITLTALLVAVAMSLVAWRVTREARERSDARIAALASEIEGEGMAVSPAAAATLSASDVATSDAGGGAERAHDRGLFAGAERAAAGSRLAPAILAGVLIVGSLVAAALALSSGNGAATAAASRETRPLELLSLRHEVDDGTLSITGLVRNPSSNQDLQRLTAVVFLFDRNGGFLASGRAPFDFTTVAPGEESPFVVTMNAPPGVARYRVSFRRDDGGMMPHVDRRDARQP